MIEIKNLKKFYGDRLIVNGLNLTIRTGTVFGFLGQNGAGKTTTIKMMAGITRPDEGEIIIAEKKSTDLVMREHIGFMPEAPYFYDRLTGGEFMEFCGNLFSKEKLDGSKNYYREILQKVNLDYAYDWKINTYSKGMKQRLGFAQSLVNNPDYVFLDEPLDGLDPLGRREIKKIILDLKTAGKTIFFNSHILYDTEEICDEIGIIDKGKLLYSGAVKEFCQGRPLEEKFVELVSTQS